MADGGRHGYPIREKKRKLDQLQADPQGPCPSSYDRWRERLKVNKMAYAEYKKQDALKQKSYRKSWSESQRIEFNEKTKIRMQKYRAKKKKEDSVLSKPSTRHQIEKKREYWRKKKQEQRNKMTQQQKEKNNTKRREDYKNSKKKLDFETPAKIRVAENRMKLPKKPEMFAATIHSALNQTTPRKKDACRKKGLIFSPKSLAKHSTNAKIVTQLKCNLKDLRNKQSKRDRQIYYRLVQAVVGKNAKEAKLRKELDIKWSYWLEISANEINSYKRIDSMSSECKHVIEKFYLNESVPLPTKATVSKKTGQQKSILTETIQQAHARYLKENPTHKVSLSQFRKMRPNEVLTVKQHKFNTCLCEYCLNVQFKLNTLNSVCMNMKKSHLKLSGKYDCVEKSLCAKETSEDQFHKLECYKRNCKHCGTHKVKEHFSDLKASDPKALYTWKRWQLGEVGVGSKTVKRQVLVEKSGTLQDLVEELAKEVQSLSMHLFVSDWQRKQLNGLKDNLPSNWVLSIADFAENYRCTHQDEIQSAYYNYQQATLFPVVTYYSCNDCEQIVEESMVFISPDLVHDSDAVKQFNYKINDHIGEKLKFSHHVQFTDGCSAQFKSKKPFYDVSESETPSMERAYFGSRHGKSRCDALGGLVKSQAETYVKSRKGTIQNAYELYEFCEANLKISPEQPCQSSHKRRVFFYQETIQRNKEKHDLKTLKGTRSLHSVRGVKPGEVKVRHLSCFCKGCVDQSDQVACQNSQFISGWVHHAIYTQNTASLSRGKQLKIKGILPGEKEKSTGRKCTPKRTPNRNTKKTNDAKREEKEEKPSKKKDHTKNKKDVKGKERNLQNIRLQLEEELAGSLPEFEDHSFVNTNKSIHRESVELVPDDMPLKSSEVLYPAEIYGDGNCLPRCGSFLAYGTEEHHPEMRKRIVLELIKNKESYLNNNVLREGKCSKGNIDVAKTFAMYSSKYAGGKLTRAEIETIYEKEVLEIMRPSTWMGVWQLASLATILKRPVVSVYPSYGNSYNVRSDLHRVFYPLEFSKGKPVYIMWTHLEGARIPKSNFSTNHFVVLMPMVPNEVIYEVEDNLIDFSDEHDEDNVSLDISSLMDMLEAADVEKSKTSDVQKSATVDVEKSPFTSTNTDTTRSWSEKPKSPAADMDSSLLEAADMEQPPSPAADIEKPPFQAEDMEQPPSPAADMDKPPFQAADRGKPQASAADMESSPAPAADMEKPPSPAPCIDKPPSPAADIEKSSSTIANAVTTRSWTEKPPSPATDMEKPPSPAADMEKPPSPATDMEKPPSPAADMEKTPSPAPDIEKSPPTTVNTETRRTLSEKAPSPAADMEKPPSPAADMEKTPSLSSDLEKSPPTTANTETRRSWSEKPPPPAADMEKPPSPAADMEETPSPAPDIEKSPPTTANTETRRSWYEKPPSPAADMEKPQSPAADMDKTPSPASDLEKSPPTTANTETRRTLSEKPPAVDMEKPPSLAADMEKTPSPAPDIEKSLPTTASTETRRSWSEKPPPPAADMEKPQSPAADMEKPQSPAADMEKTPSPAPDIEKSPPTTASTETRRSWSEKPPSPAADMEKPQSPAADMQKTPSPAPDIETSPPTTANTETRRTLSEKAPSPAADMENPPSPAADMEKTPSPASDLEKSPSTTASTETRRSWSEKPPSPAADMEKPESQPADMEKPPSPTADMVKPPSPSADMESSPSPAAGMERPQSPSADMEKPPSQAADVVKIPSTAAYMEKTPAPDIEKSPPTPSNTETRRSWSEKSSSPLADTERSATADTEKSPSTTINTDPTSVGEPVETASDKRSVLSSGGALSDVQGTEIPHGEPVLCTEVQDEKVMVPFNEELQAPRWMNGRGSPSSRRVEGTRGY